jgi:hypothetical protein
MAILNQSASDKLITTIIKGAEVYVLIYDEQHLPELMAQVGRMAAEPELSFSWYDAAAIGTHLRSVVEPG